MGSAILGELGWDLPPSCLQIQVCPLHSSQFPYSLPREQLQLHDVCFGGLVGVQRAPNLGYLVGLQKSIALAFGPRLRDSLCGVDVKPPVVHCMIEDLANESEGAVRHDRRFPGVNPVNKFLYITASDVPCLSRLPLRQQFLFRDSFELRV